jgi:hypothetical protein
MKPTIRTVLRIAAIAMVMATIGDVSAQNNTQPPAPRPVAVQPLGVGPLDPQGNWPVKIFELKYVTASNMNSILQIFRAEISFSTFPTSSGVRREILSVRAPQEIMPAIEETIARFDVPPPPAPPRVPTKTVEVSVQIVGAYETAAASACATCAIPESLRPVITQLQKTFSYKTYQLLDTQVYRQLNYTPLDSTNSLPGMNDVFARYTIHWSQVIASPDTMLVHLYGFQFDANVNVLGTGTSTAAFGFKSEVELPADQQVAIGKTTVGSNALILVLRAKVLD